MDFRKLGHGHTLQRPAFDPEELTDEAFTFKGEFDDDELLIESGEFAEVKGQ